MKLKVFLNCIIRSYVIKIKLFIMNWSQLDTFEKSENLIEFLNNSISELKFLNSKYLLGKYKCLKKNIDLLNLNKGQDCFVLGNAPSLDQNDISKLRNYKTFMVNRAVDHPKYDLVNPNYHVIIDPKLVDGTWSLSLIDKIIEKSPNTKLFLNADWYENKKILSYKNKIEIYWLKHKTINLFNYKKKTIDLTTIYPSYMVVEQCITIALFMGFKNIYCFGYEGDGIKNLLNNENMHFDGKDLDYLNSSPYDISRAMSANARFIRTIYLFKELCENHNANLFNLTPRGILKMINSKKFSSVVK